MPVNNATYIEGEAKAEDLVYVLADEITGAALKDLAGAVVTNRWVEVYRQNPDQWVTYNQKFRTNVTGIYTHTDLLSYTVYQVNVVNSLYVDANGYVNEKNTVNGGNTGRKLKVKGPTTYTDRDGASVTENIETMLLAKTPQGTAILYQERKNLDNTIEADIQWMSFQFRGYLNEVDAGNWSEFLGGSSQWYISWNTINDSGSSMGKEIYKFTERYYDTNPTHFAEKTVVIKSIPDNADGSTSLDEYFVMFKHPQSQNNYFDIYYGQGFAGTNAVGDAEESYIRACNPLTVKPLQVPTVINQLEAEAAWKRQQSSSFVPATESWKIDIDGVTQIKSPPTHFFYGADSTIPWVVSKKRRPDYFVSYFLSVSNSRVSIVMEGDPAPDLDGYYRTFGYIGRIVPFNQFDNANNFAVTAGMGELSLERTGFVKNDILQDQNSEYAGFGRYTSNGMYSVSMLATRANVLFQAHYPAFVTQLPNYPTVGTIPTELSRLILEKNGFQMSQWTDRYHGSPIYLAHQYEGYRGYMDGVIAINDHNLINLDELIVDTEEPKEGGGTWTEVYKFFSLKSPISMFDTSANPDGMTVAILKEVK